jgi:diguanylate cyclase (GGDEF)-like protein
MELKSAGMDAEPQQLRHFLVIEDAQRRRTVSLEATTYSIGRAVTNAIVLYSKQVSRQHATLLRVTPASTHSYRFRIIDGDLKGRPSSNGLTVNGHRCFWRDLEHGDVIEFGQETKAQYFAIANLSEDEFRQSQEVPDLMSYLDSLQKPLRTLVLDNNGRDPHNEAALFRLASFPELIPYPILELDFSGQITYLNPAAAQAFPTLPDSRLEHPVLQGLLALVQEQPQHFWAREVLVAGDTFEQFIHLFPESDLIRSYLLNITKRKQAEAQLLHDAFHDRLTGLANRALFLDRLNHAIERSHRHSSELFAVLFLDLDRFKLINDSLGHGIGDQLLVAIARRLETCLRTVDTVARLGGDEFVLLLEALDSFDDVAQVAERIQAELSVPFNLSGREVYTTVSMGIAFSTLKYTRAEELLRDADTAMYRAKAQGKACYKIFDGSMHSQAVALLQMETDLRRALNRQEFLLYYQPLIWLETGKIKGFEALVRWQHPEQGLISPATFIPLAEETGLINPLGTWIFRVACRQVGSWQQQLTSDPEQADAPPLPLTININVSGKQLLQRNWIHQVEQILEDTAIPAGNIILEITESILVENADSMTDLLQQVRDLGIHIHIDDFGTGYSSLSYLHTFPIDGLKIDRSFINRLDASEKNVEIIRTILTMAQSLGIGVTAEGIETDAQLRLLRQLGCPLAQGYYFSKPMTALEVEAWLPQYTAAVKAKESAYYGAPPHDS